MSAAARERICALPLQKGPASPSSMELRRLLSLHPEPLAGPRLTVMGQVAPAPDPADLARYVARHPGAQAWAAMGDFRLYRLDPVRAHLVAGFGRIAWIEAAALFLPPI